MTEQQKFMGRLQELKNKSQNLKLQIEGLRDALRDNLDPFEPVEDLKDEMISIQGIEVHKKIISYREVLAEIKQAKRILGGS